MVPKQGLWVRVGVREGGQLRGSNHWGTGARGG